MKLNGLVILIFVFSLGCQRSTAFKKDQDYYQESESGQSYYFKGAAPKSPTARVAQMGQPKKRLFVFDYWNDTPIKVENVESFAADELRRGLFQSQRVIVPPELKTEMKTYNFVQGDRIKVAQLIREGRNMGVAVLVVGRISRIVFRQKGDEVGVFRQKQSLAAVDLELKVFDVAGGREIAAVGRSGEASSSTLIVFDPKNMESQEFRSELTKLAIRNAMTGLIPEVLKSVEKMSWEGRIAKITGSKVYVNAGRASGIITGDILKVISQGEEVHDPVSGVYLGRTQGQVKGTLEVKDFIGPDGAVSEVHSGSNFQEGDSVQLY